MRGLEGLIEKHQGIISVIGGLLVTAVTLTAYALTTFSTKQETKEALNQNQRTTEALMERIEKRLDHIEYKVDDLLSESNKRSRQ